MFIKAPRLMHKDFISFADILKNEPELDVIRNAIKKSDVIIEFEKIFPEFSKVAVPVKVEKYILFLRVENAAWRNELKFKESLVVQKINNFFKEERINQIKFLS